MNENKKKQHELQDDDLYTVSGGHIRERFYGKSDEHYREYMQSYKGGYKLMRAAKTEGNS